MKNLNRIIYLIATTFILVLSVAFITYSLTNKVSYYFESKYEIVVPIVTGLTTVILFYLINNLLFRNLKRIDEISYNIAVIGFPESGKTTLITTLFGGIIHKKIALKNYNYLLKGNATIEKVNENLRNLDKGIPIGSTTDQTIFAYRLNIEEKYSSIIRPKKMYNVEIGDFQGEMTEELINLNNNIWRHDSDFFNWVKDAHAYIFIVDLGKYFLEKKDYVADISSSFRSAWQKILELNSSQTQKIRNNKLILVFNKADLLLYNELYKEDILKIAFTQNNFNLPKLRNEEIPFYKTNDVLFDFENLISFFRNENNNFSYCFSSSLLVDDIQNKLGLNEIANHIIPK